jgi:hypothetical protein
LWLLGCGGWVFFSALRRGCGGGGCVWSDVANSFVEVVLAIPVLMRLRSDDRSCGGIEGGVCMSRRIELISRKAEREAWTSDKFPKLKRKPLINAFAGKGPC